MEAEFYINETTNRVRCIFDCFKCKTRLDIINEIIKRIPMILFSLPNIYLQNTYYEINGTCPKCGAINRIDKLRYLGV